MISGIIYTFFHLACMFLVIVYTRVLFHKDVIEDMDMYLIVGIFVPWGVLVWLAASHVGEKLSDSLT